MRLRCAGILAAGEGDRFRRRGYATPKALLPVGGVPMIERCLASLRHAGIEEVHCILHPDAEAVRQRVEAMDTGLQVKFVMGSTPSSLHSLFALAPELQRHERFLLSTVDAIADQDELDEYVAAGAEMAELDGLLACTSFVQDENPLGLELDAEHRILRFADAGQVTECVTGGMYVLSSRIFDEMERARGLGVERLRNFLRLLVERGYVLRGHHFSKIVDVDDPEDLAEAERYVRDLAVGSRRR